MKQTDTTKLEYNQETDDLDNEQMEERVDGVNTIGKRSLICKTMATIKSRSTFVENGGAKISPGKFNISTLVFGNDSLTRTPLKGGSVGQGFPSHQEFGPNVSTSINKG